MIAAALSTTSDSGAAIMFVGESGVGKTALLNVAAVGASQMGHLVVRFTGAGVKTWRAYSRQSQASSTSAVSSSTRTARATPGLSPLAAAIKPVR